MKQNEVSLLKHWQRKYLFESYVVMFVLVCILLGVCCVITYWGVLLIVGGLLAAVLGLMLRALREGLQNRAEMLIWENHKHQFNGLEFDVGAGVATDILENHDVFQGRQARECFNVLKSADYSFEEDLFYTEHRLKWFSIRNTAFRGVIICFKANMQAANVVSEGNLVRGNVIVDGLLKDFVAKNDGLKEWARILRLLHADKMKIVADNGYIYFWIKTSRRLFYQFSLWEYYISPLPFITRVQQFQQAAEKLKEAYNS